MKLAGGGQHLVDREGTVLSVEDVELDAFEPLATVSGQGLTAPSDARSGIVWKSRSSTGPDEVDERIVAAARLARFLKQEFNRQRADSSSDLRMIHIITTDFGRRGLFVLNSKGTEFCWGSEPGGSGLVSRRRPRSGRCCSSGAKPRRSVRWKRATTGSSRRGCRRCALTRGWPHRRKDGSSRRTSPSGQPASSVSL